MLQRKAKPNLAQTTTSATPREPITDIHNTPPQTRATPRTPATTRQPRTSRSTASTTSTTRYNTATNTATNTQRNINPAPTRRANTQRVLTHTTTPQRTLQSARLPSSTTQRVQNTTAKNTTANTNANATNATNASTKTTNITNHTNISSGLSRTQRSQSTITNSSTDSARRKLQFQATATETSRRSVGSVGAPTRAQQITRNRSRSFSPATTTREQARPFAPAVVKSSNGPNGTHGTQFVTAKRLSCTTRSLPQPPPRTTKFSSNLPHTIEEVSPAAQPPQQPSDAASATTDKAKKPSLFQKIFTTSPQSQPPQQNEPSTPAFARVSTLPNTNPIPTSPPPVPNTLARPQPAKFKQTQPSPSLTPEPVRRLSKPTNTVQRPLRRTFSDTDTKTATNDATTPGAPGVLRSFFSKFGSNASSATPRQTQKTASPTTRTTNIRASAHEVSGATGSNRFSTKTPNSLPLSAPSTPNTRLSSNGKKFTVAASRATAPATTKGTALRPTSLENSRRLRLSAGSQRSSGESSLVVLSPTRKTTTGATTTPTTGKARLAPTTTATTTNVRRRNTSSGFGAKRVSPLPSPHNTETITTAAALAETNGDHTKTSTKQNVIQQRIPSVRKRGGSNLLGAAGENAFSQSFSVLRPSIVSPKSKMSIVSNGKSKGDEDFFHENMVSTIEKQPINRKHTASVVSIQATATAVVNTGPASRKKKLIPTSNSERRKSLKERTWDSLTRRDNGSLCVCFQSGTFEPIDGAVEPLSVYVVAEVEFIQDCSKIRECSGIEVTWKPEDPLVVIPLQSRLPPNEFNVVVFQKRPGLRVGRDEKIGVGSCKLSSQQQAGTWRSDVLNLKSTNGKYKIRLNLSCAVVRGGIDVINNRMPVIKQISETQQSGAEESEIREKRQRMRAHVVAELIETEATYVEALRLISTVFLQPLLQNCSNKTQPQPPQPPQTPQQKPQQQQQTTPTTTAAALPAHAVHISRSRAFSESATNFFNNNSALIEQQQQTPTQSPTQPQTPQTTPTSPRKNSNVVIPPIWPNSVPSNATPSSSSTIIPSIVLSPRSAANNNSLSISETDVRIMFPSIEMLLSLHEREFLPRLEATISEGGNGLGEVFVNCANYLRMYINYVNSYEDGIKRLKELLQTNQKFAAFIETAQNDPRLKGLKLVDMLIKPFQRLTKYHLLLRELHKFTDQNMTEKTTLGRAVDLVGHVTQEINEKRRENESVKKVLEISFLVQGTIKNFLVPTRRFVCEGSFVRHKLPNKTKKYPIQLYLFSDTISAQAVSNNGAEKSGQIEKSATHQIPQGMLVAMREKNVVCYFELANLMFEHALDETAENENILRFYSTLTSQLVLDVSTNIQETKVKFVDWLLDLNVPIEGFLAPANLLAAKYSRRILLLGADEDTGGAFLASLVLSRTPNTPSYNEHHKIVKNCLSKGTLPKSTEVRVALAVNSLLCFVSIAFHTADSLRVSEFDAVIICSALEDSGDINAEELDVWTNTLQRLEKEIPVVFVGATPAITAATEFDALQRAESQLQYIVDYLPTATKYVECDTVDEENVRKIVQQTVAVSFPTKK